MISADVYIIDFGTGGITSDVRVTVRSDAEGIHSAELRDHDGVPFLPPGTLNANCAPAFTFDVPRIARGQFPVFVWARECVQGAPGNELVPLGPFLRNGSLDDGTQPQPPRTCPPPILGAPPSAECVAERDAAGEIRNELLETCARLGQALEERDLLIVLMSVMTALAAALFVLAIHLTVQAVAHLAVPFFGWAMSIAAAIAAAIVYAFAVAAAAAAIHAAIGLAQKLRLISDLQRQIDTLRRRFREAAMRVRSVCCPGDYFETEVILPSCSRE